VGDFELWRRHDMTDDWYDIYDAVGDWFETILLKYGDASLLLN